jgi:hypothetical protein
MITTADGVVVMVGDSVFSHYTMREHIIATDPDDTGWFYVINSEGRDLLNGERICSLEHARRMGWLNH